MASIADARTYDRINAYDEHVTIDIRVRDRESRPAKTPYPLPRNRTGGDGPVQGVRCATQGC